MANEQIGPIRDAGGCVVVQVQSDVDIYQHVFCMHIMLELFGIHLLIYYHVLFSCQKLTHSDFHFRNQNVLEGAIFFFWNQYSNIVCPDETVQQNDGK